MGFWEVLDRLFVNLISLQVECHTIPHMKFLTHGVEHASGYWHGNTFILQKFNLKSTNFAS